MTPVSVPPSPDAVAGVPEPPARSAAMSKMRSGMAVMVVLGSVANAVNYASSLVFSRILEPVGFGELTSLLALTLVLAVPLGAAQTVIAERVAVASSAGDHERVRWLIRHALGHVAALAVVVGTLYILAIPLVVSTLDIRAPGPAMAVAPLLVLSFLNPLTMGVLQGLERFAALGVVMLLVATSRLIFGVPWTLAGGGAGGAIAGQAVGLLAVHLIAAWSFRSLLIRRGTGAATSGVRRRLDLRALTASAAFVGFALLSNLDLVLARVYLNNLDAGIYAALATVAKVVIFLPSAVAILMVPSAAKAHASSGDSSRVLKLSSGVVALVALGCVVPAALAPGLVVDIMFGEGYDAAESGVVPAVIAGALLAMLNLLCTYSVAIRDRRWIWLLCVGVVLQVTAIGLFHDSPMQIAWAQVGVAAVVLLLNELLLHGVLLPRRRRTVSA